jgi:hypothetical protein
MAASDLTSAANGFFIVCISTSRLSFAMRSLPCLGSEDLALPWGRPDALIHTCSWNGRGAKAQSWHLTGDINISYRPLCCLLL